MKVHCIFLVADVGPWFVQFADSPFDLGYRLYADLLYFLASNDSTLLDHVLRELRIAAEDASKCCFCTVSG